MDAPQNSWFTRKLAGVTTRVLALDPGETTGVAVFEGAYKLYEDQLSTKDVAAAAKRIAQLIDGWRIQVVVCEDYRVYAWKIRQHAWSSLHTPRLIGALELICSVAEVPLVKQTAQVAKTFCTDEKLEEWGVNPARRHERDAIRHACYYLLFGKEKPNDQESGEASSCDAQSGGSSNGTEIHRDDAHSEAAKREA